MVVASWLLGVLFFASIFRVSFGGMTTLGYRTQKLATVPAVIPRNEKVRFDPC